MRRKILIHREHHSGNQRKVFTITPERCSRSIRIGVHDAPESVFTFGQNMQHREIFAICFEKIAVASLSGELISIQKLPETSKVIGQQRTPGGWRCLCREGSGLTNYSLSADQNSEVKLLEPSMRESIKTAAWSPCGQYVAVGSEDITLSVWNTESGQLVMQKSVNWGNEDPFIIEPTLDVISWSKMGKEIITTAGVIMSNNVLIWDFQTKKLITVIN